METYYYRLGLLLKVELHVVIQSEWKVFEDLFYFKNRNRKENELPDYTSKEVDERTIL